MLRRLIFLLLIVAAAPSPAEAQRAPRVDPTLRALMRPAVRSAIERAPDLGRGAPRERLPLRGLIALDRAGPSDSPRVGVLVRLRDARGLSLLRAVGAEIGTVVGDIVTARVPVDALDRLARSVELQELQAARTLEVVALPNDSSTVDMGAVQVRQPEADGDWLGFTGEGVIVGIYDTGLDYDHEDFLDPAGSTRLLGLWDQTRPPDRLEGAPSPLYDYGYFCGPAALNDGSCLQADINGHGTHVAGSAAGDGSAAGTAGTIYQHAGVAPEAGLLIVKGGNGSFSEDQIIDGVAWIFDRATELGLPAVVNLSLGSQYGPHDGTRLYEQAINDLTGPGRIVVVSAGNAGSNNNTGEQQLSHYIHAMAPLTAGVTEAFSIQVPAYESSSQPCDDLAAIDLWYEGADQVDITVVRPDGTMVSAPHGAEVSDAASGGTVYIWNAAAGASPDNLDYEAYVEFSGCGTSAPIDGTWQIQATPTVAVSGRPLHLWLFQSSFGANGVGARGIGSNFDNSHIVASPATAENAIAVAAHVTRLCWPSQEGNVCYTEPEDLGDVARFSSGGPARDGRLKPEISAPGMAIVSALSSDVNASSQLIAPDGVHFANQGTSMAAPHVTGAIALLLDFRSNLTPGEIEDVFSRTAVQDAFTDNSYTRLDGDAGSPNYQWGYGKLDVKAALQDLGAFGNAATLLVAATPLAPTRTQSSQAGTRVPLIRLDLRVDGSEAVDVTALGFDVVGNDPEARIVVLRDLDRDGNIDPTDLSLGSAAAALEPGDTVRVRVQPDGFRIAAADSAVALIALEMSGAAPNSSAFSATYVWWETRSIGTESGVRNLVAQSVAYVESNDIQTTVLRPDEVFALSENPVRSGEVIFNFSERPRVAGVYTLDGRRVADLLERMTSNNRVVWDLTNDRGSDVAAGIYLVVFDVAGELIRKKLFVVRPAAGGQE